MSPLALLHSPLASPSLDERARAAIGEPETQPTVRHGQ
jgi:hypothetical protein